MINKKILMLIHVNLSKIYTLKTDFGQTYSLSCSFPCTWRDDDNRKHSNIYRFEPFPDYCHK